MFLAQTTTSTEPTQVFSDETKQVVKQAYEESQKIIGKALSDAGTLATTPTVPLEEPASLPTTLPSDLSIPHEILNIAGWCQVPVAIIACCMVFTAWEIGKEGLAERLKALKIRTTCLIVLLSAVLGSDYILAHYVPHVTQNIVLCFNSVWAIVALAIANADYCYYLLNYGVRYKEPQSIAMIGAFVFMAAAIVALTLKVSI